MLLSPGVLDDLRHVLVGHDYTVDAVLTAIGAGAHAALARNSTVPALRALGDRDDALATVIRLWPLQSPVSRDAADAALPGLVDALLAAGLLAGDDRRVQALVDLRPYATEDADFLVWSDLTPGLDTQVAPMRPEYVLGLSSASSTLAQLTIRRPVGSALDLGTGCGVQALHLAAHADRVTATDVNARALELAAMTWAMNGVEVEVLDGSLYEPVRGRRFDLITTNPPYVMSPPRSAEPRLAYRETGSVADELMQHLVRHAGEHLNPAGTCQVLGNWAHRHGQPWEERLASWVAGTGLDLHVVQREVLDVPAYVELWLADAGLAGSRDYRSRYAEWLDYFDQLQIEAVGLGWLLLTRAGRHDPWVRIEDWPYAVEQPIAPALAAEGGWVDASRLGDDAILARAWALTDDVVEETTGQPGAADPQHIVFRQQRAFRRAVEADTALAGVLGACDGDLPLGVVIDVLAGLLGVDPTALRVDLLPRFRPLIADGWFA
ncbi:MAG TPA: methyltransferase [Microlunatus sp.]|nr:methyltransferase [Microlunatus sp.]